MAKPSATKKSSSKKTTGAKKAAGAKLSKKVNTKKPENSLTPEGENEKTLLLQGQQVSLTNLQKRYWPKEGFTKGNVADYYLKMAPYLLPYLLHRPHALNRHPNGINAPHFFQKNMRGKLPGWIKIFEEFSESTGKTVHYFVCNSEADLLYMVNLGCIEINPWHARTKDYQKPDWCLIDLDPDKSNSFDQVVEVAQVVKKVLDSVGATSCVKTSGATGMHIYLPLGAAYDFDHSKKLAEKILQVVHKELPQRTSLERTPAKRKGKIYLDFLQNKETQTAAAPYSLRPKPGVPASTPLHWEEVKKGLSPTTWTAFNIEDRVKAEGDLFAPVLGKGIDLAQILKKLEPLI